MTAAGVCSDPSVFFTGILEEQKRTSHGQEGRTCGACWQVVGYSRVAFVGYETTFGCISLGKEDRVVTNAEEYPSSGPDICHRQITVICRNPTSGQ